MGEKNLTEENFDRVISGEKPLLVDFWAPWCGPCQMMAPILEELAKELKEVIIGKVNINKNPEIPKKYHVMSVPTFLLFKGGKVVGQLIGAVSKDSLTDMIKKHLDPKLP